MANVKFSPTALRRAIKAWGHTQQQAATEMDVSMSAVADWVNGRKTPRGAYMRIVLDYMSGATGRRRKP